MFRDKPKVRGVAATLDYESNAVGVLGHATYVVDVFVPQTN